MKRKPGQTVEDVITRDRFEVEPLDQQPRVGQVRHLTLTLPNSQYSFMAPGKMFDTTVTLTVEEAYALADRLRAAGRKLEDAL